MHNPLPNVVEQMSDLDELETTLQNSDVKKAIVHIGFLFSQLRLCASSISEEV